MKVTVLGLCIALAACVAQAEDAPSMKPGLWEWRLLKMEQDGKDELKARGNPVVRASQCVSPEVVKNGWLVNHLRAPENGNCSPPKVTRSGNRFTVLASCPNKTSKGEWVVASSERVTNRIEVVMTVDGVKHTTIQEAQMTFVGSDCGNVRAFDQRTKNDQAPKR